jgi:ribonuclease HI
VKSFAPSESAASHRATREAIASASSRPEQPPEFLLVCEARSTAITDGYWRFTLETAAGELVLDADDHETGDLNRLTLLAAVRGLEAIEGPSSVTLLSNNRYLIRSLSESLPRWRQNGFVWEHFGRRVDVQHADLWRRIDRALAIHRVEACLLSTRLVSAGPCQAAVAGDVAAETAKLRIDAAHVDPETETAAVPAPQLVSARSDRLRHWLLQGVAGGGAQTAGRRFTPQDLLETA